MTMRIWYPYTQMQLMESPLEVVDAHGCTLHLKDERELIDSIASWWCVIHGYNHPALNRALTEQLEKVAHVMLGGLTHAPAMDLAAKLIEITPEGLSHVFYGDSGSVGMEIALKLAVQYWANRGRPAKRRFLALRKAYHGDTCGVMSVCDPDDGMHALFKGFLPEQLFLDAPTPLEDAGSDEIYRDIVTLNEALETHGDELAAFVAEPLMQCAGGFNMYSEEYLRQARRLCDEHEVLFVFDEVATGFGRTGAMFAADKAEVCPDILVLGKALTGGYLGHSATLATSEVFEVFLADDPKKAFMHGPTFMGNPLACAVALAGIELFEREDYLGKIARIEALLREHLLPLESDKVKDVRVMGATGVVDVYNRKSLEGLQTFAAERGVWLRPFERYAYTMPPYIVTEEELLRIITVLREWFAG